jgi:anti-sigma B factor antagonist
MARFEATTSDEAGRVRVALAGECDLEVREEMTATLLDALHRSPVVVVDGRKLFVVNPTGAVATVLDLTGVGALLSPPPGSGCVSP